MKKSRKEGRKESWEEEIEEPKETRRERLIFPSSRIIHYSWICFMILNLKDAILLTSDLLDTVTIVEIRR
jgi:hypothetical protein